MDFSLRTIRALTVWLFFIPIASAATAELGQPSWAQLSPQQRHALAPLALEWNTMEAFRRKKWLGIAARYDALSAEEQTRMQRRMRDWARLTPEERKQAREKYKALQKMSPDQRESLRQNWEDYKALPPHERQRLQDEAARRSPLSTLPSPSTTRPKLRQPTAPSGAR